MQRGPRNPTLVAAALTILVLAVAVTAILARPGGSTGAHDSHGTASAFDGAVLGSGIPAPGFTLTDQNGRRVALSNYRGRVVVLSFLYSTCGAPCDLIAQQIRGALDDLPAPATVLIVSADPGADTPSSVAKFLARVSLSGRVEYLTGAPAEVRAVARGYRLKLPGEGGASAFGRTTPVVVIDREGLQRVLFEVEQLTPESLAHDIGTLQSG